MPRRKEPNYLYLIIGLLTAVILIISVSPHSLLRIWGVAFLIIIGDYILIERKGQMLFVALLGALVLIPFAWVSAHRESFSLQMVNTIYILSLGFWMFFTFYIGQTVFRNLLSARRISSNEIYGAIFMYLLIGVVFAEIYQVMLALQPDAIYFDPKRFPPPELIIGTLDVRSAGEVLYYSFVTLGTVGYGDVIPSSPLARSLSMIEAVTGIMYVATMIARFVSIHTSNRGSGAEPEQTNRPASRAKDSSEKKAEEETM